MALQGLDTAAAPGPGQAKAMLDEIGGAWWNVYIGGPRSDGSGWTPGLLREYGRHGIRRFLLLYAGRQQGDAGLLTASQGEEDGNQAFQLAREFGFSAPRTPLCLDLEGEAFDAFPQASLDYACGWCRAVRGHDFRPGVYSSPGALRALAPRNERPGWVWIASWVRHRVNPQADPHRAAGFPGHLWPRPGERAWQYAAAFGNIPCRVRGVDVDISVADGGCLASPGATAPPHERPHAHPQPHPQPAPARRTYTVRPGDTLSGIAARLHVAGGWPALYERNRAVIGPDPDLIRPGQVLRLP